MDSENEVEGHKEARSTKNNFMAQVDILVQECKWHLTAADVERILLIALMDGAIVGSSAITRDARSHEDLYIESTFVNENHRRMGIARMLNESSLDAAKREKAKRVWASIHRSNRFYLRWFLNHGFRVHSKNEIRDTVLIVCEL